MGDFIENICATYLTITCNNSKSDLLPFEKMSFLLNKKARVVYEWNENWKKKLKAREEKFFIGKFISLTNNGKVCE